MMAQAGIPVPAEQASFPVFTAFLADIGDAQSIEAALDVLGSILCQSRSVGAAGR